MATRLDQLVRVRSRLVEEVLAYLDAVAERAAELPKYYPAHLRTGEKGKTRFDEVRQMVQVVEDRAGFERWLAEERERLRAAGQDVERVAYDPTRSRPETGEDGRGEFGDGGRGRPEPTPPVPWDKQAGERFRRAIILGDPGFGKTWLLRYEARRLARQAAEQLREQKFGLNDIVPPIFVRLSDLSRMDGPVEEALVALISRRWPERFRSFVRDGIEAARWAVLLDAWDEVRPQQALGQRLKEFSRNLPQLRILLTSRIVGYDPINPPIREAKELELLAFDPPQTESFAGIWFGDAPPAAHDLLAMLRQNHQVRGLARIPLMLALTCRAWSECRKAGRPFPNRRVELYGRCLRGLLRDWKIEDEKPDAGDEAGALRVTNAYVDAVLELLGNVALALFTEGYEQFSDSVLRDKMRPWLRDTDPSDELYRRSPADLIAELKRDGILIAIGESRDAPLLFLHRTFQEYLAACELARRASKEQDGKWEEIAGFVDRKAWLPAWQEVIVLLAGKLTNPKPLLDMLSDPAPPAEDRPGDDHFRHRLALAALCLPEISQSVRAQLRVQGEVDRVTGELFSIWVEHEKAGREEAVSHLRRALPALALVNGRVRGERLLDLMARLLEDPEEEMQLMALEAVSRLGAAAATSDILAALARLLAAPDRYVRSRAAHAVIGLGATAATPGFLAALTRLLENEDWDVCRSAARALSCLGAAGATPGILSGLVRLLEPEDGYRSDEVYWAVESLGRAAATPDFLAALAHLMKAGRVGTMGYPDARWNAEFVVGKLGATAATPDFLAALTRLLADRDDEVRRVAAEAVGRLGAAAATPKTLAALARLLGDLDPFVRSSAAGALGRLGRAAATPDILSVLYGLLEDKAWAVRGPAAESFARLSAGSVPPGFLATVVRLLASSYGFVQDHVVEALGHLGAAAATPDLLSALRRFLEDEHPAVREGAVKAVGRLGAPAATRDILAALAPLVVDPHLQVESSAAKAVERLGAAAATPDFLAVLAQFLQAGDWRVCGPAAKALGGMGAAAATPDILAILARLLRDEDWRVWKPAAKAVGRLGPAAATPDILAALVRLLAGTESLMQTWVPDAVGGLGSAAATPDILAALSPLLENEDRDVRRSTASVVGSLHSAGIRIFGRRLRWTAQSIDDLAADP